MNARSPLISVELASYQAGTLLDQVALAAALRVAPRTLRRMVTRLEIPPDITLGGKKVWLAEKVREHLSGRADSDGRSRDLDRLEARFRTHAR